MTMICNPKPDTRGTQNQGVSGFKGYTKPDTASNSLLMRVSGILCTVYPFSYRDVSKLNKILHKSNKIYNIN